MIFFTGCSSLPKMITKVEYKTIHIPEAYFNLSEIDTNRSIITNRDVSLFMLDLYKAYNVNRRRMYMSIKDMKKIALKDGYVVVPEDWIIVNGKNSEDCKYAYVLETSDDNLFLRTCFCKKDWQLEDRELPVNNSSPLIDRVDIHIFDESLEFFS